MELRALCTYRDVKYEFQSGDSTLGKKYTEEEKQQMLEDFPDWFEVVDEKTIKADKKKADEQMAIDQAEARAAAEASKKKGMFESDPMTSTDWIDPEKKATKKGK